MYGRAEPDPTNPIVTAICDRCGILHNLDMLQWQLRYAGPGLINSRLLVCRICVDIPAPFVVPQRLPQDPEPLFNARSEPFEIDETDFRITEEEDQRITEDGQDRVVDSSSSEGTE